MATHTFEQIETAVNRLVDAFKAEGIPLHREKHNGNIVLQ
jgi:8-amino-7-oxononanoate synthase